MDDVKKSPPKLLDCVLQAGAALIVLRHVAKSPEDAAKVNMKHDLDCFNMCHADAVKKVDAAIEELTDSNGHGIMTMRFGHGLRFLQVARHCIDCGDMRGAYIATLEAHDSFERVLSAHKVATPTNKDIAGVIAFVNRR